MGQGRIGSRSRSPEIGAAVRRWWWLIALAAIVGALAGLFIGQRIPPKYTATTSLVVGPGTELAEPLAVLKRLEYQSDARLVLTAGDLASAPDMLSKAADSLGVSAGGHSSKVAFNAGSHIVVIAVKGPTAETAARLADEIGRITTAEFSAGYPHYRVTVIDRETSAARSLGRPLYVPPVVFALAAALAASAAVITLHNRPRRRKITADGPALADQANESNPSAAALPVLNRGPLLPNLAVAGLVGLVAGVVAAGSGAAAFSIAALAGAAAVAAVALRPEWALVGLIALVTLRLAENARDFYGIPQLTIPVIAVVVLVLFFRRFVWGERPTGLATALGAVSLVAIASLVSVINASYPDASLGPMVELAKSAVVLVLVIVLINSARDYRLAIWTLIVLGGLIAGLSVFQYLTGSFGRPFFGLAQARIMNIAFDVNDYRISGPFGDPNFFGQALVPIFAIALERAWHESRRHLRLVAAVAVVVVPLAIIFTFSRGALIALAVVGVAMLFSLRPSWRAIAAGAAALAVVIILLPPGYVERTTALFETNEAAVVSSDPSVDQRTSIFLAGLQMFYDYPVAGIGIGNFPDRYLEYAGEIGLDHTRAAIQPHSFFIEIAAETGLIGLLAWGVVGVFIIEIFRRARRRLAEAGERGLYQMITAYAIGLLGFYTAGLFLHLAFARYMWVLLGIVFAIPKVVESVIASRRTAVEAS